MINSCVTSFSCSLLALLAAAAWQPPPHHCCPVKLELPQATCPKRPKRPTRGAAKPGSLGAASPPSLQPSTSLRETVRMLVTGSGAARDRVGSGIGSTKGGGTGDGAMASVEQEAALAGMDVGRLARARSPIIE